MLTDFVLDDEELKLETSQNGSENKLTRKASFEANTTSRVTKNQQFLSSTRKVSDPVEQRNRGNVERRQNLSKLKDLEIPKHILKSKSSGVQ